ncbi:MAG: sigma-54-dependent transcriptional regulator [Planctomycetota bacterium]|jgi:DNA-binding NtrC family response regulator
MNPTATDPKCLSILVVDDEVIVRESLEAWFSEDGYRVDTAESGRAALRLAAENAYDIALIDIKMPNMDGLELQARLAEAVPDLTIVIMTAYATVETAVHALKAGAYDYIVKPFDPDELSHLIRRAQEHRSLQSENIRLKQSLEAAAPAVTIIGESPSMARVHELIGAVAPTDATVLIEGESGTGKELVARAIHAKSPRRYNPMVEVHCGALAESLLESELFGHEKGAFTGASYRHKGKFEQADGGTIFLDEISDITPRVQIELLRVVEEKRVTRVGGKHPIPVDFRIVAATNRDLRALVKEGAFREDLLWRLDVVPIELPPLRERAGDIPLLAEHFLQRLCSAMNRKGLQLSPSAVEALQAYGWPGNVRELQNAIERAVVLGTPPTIEVQDLPHFVRAKGGPRPRSHSLADVERAHIERVLQETAWNISRAARMLGVDRGTLYNKIHKYELKKQEHA